MSGYEVNFDGLVGPTHHYAGLSFGNEASTQHQNSVSNPKLAAKQGLLKMKALADLGFQQGVLPPQERPHLPMLRRLGFSGSDETVLAQVMRQSPRLLSALSSASCMWARLVRGQILSLRERDFMLATEVLGLSTRRRLFGHLLPNTVPILVVVATMAVANAILSESALSYLGLGVVPPTPSWGNMMDAANSLIDFQRRPWLWMPPGLAIFVTVVAINILGDGLRDALDPKMNGVTR